jgi:ABC-type transport system involved in cytochrome c biogenesis permease component
MRWLFLKDLKILRRSPFLLALLVLYPIVISVLMGLALSAGPDKPAVAILNEIPPSGNSISLGGESLDVSKYSTQLYSRVDPVKVSTREEAIEKVESGQVLAALIIPSDVTAKLEAGLQPATVEVYYNAEDPVKAAFVQDVLKSQVADANLALTQRFTAAALQYINLIGTGGTFSVLGQTLDILGLEKSEQILTGVAGSLSGADKAGVDQVINFAKVARDNLTLANGVLESVGDPIRVETHVVKGGSTPLTSYATAIAVTISLMFVTLLLASGTLALEREEGVFGRLVRGLVSPTGLLVEKVLLSAVCALGVGLVMLVGLALFTGLDISRAPAWIAALAFGALAFAGMGVALGAITREVRAASLLAFMISLPIAFLALVPSGAVAGPVYWLIRAVTAIFPFGGTLDALDAALNGAGSLLPPLIHLAAVAIGFAVIARLALRRFA